MSLLSARRSFFWLALLPTLLTAQQTANQSAAQPQSNAVFGFRNFAPQRAIDEKFIAVPDAGLAEQHLKALTAEPHSAGTPEDKKTADYVAQKFREAGLETQIVEYKVLIPTPLEVSVDLTAPNGVSMRGPTREHVEGDPFQDDPRVLMPFNGYSPSGDVEAEVVYANYCQPADFKKLAELGVAVKGKIAICRYGANFRGVKSYVANEQGAAGVIIYSDPIDDGYFKGDVYPTGPFRPATSVQRGSLLFTFIYPGDPTTPQIASTLDLPDAKRTPQPQATSLPKIPTTPLSYYDAQPIMASLQGPESPRDWQGALPFTYHLGPGPARVRMHIKIDFSYKTIWDVIGIARGSEFPDEWVIGGNHRDAWVYGAVDPNSGTASMLESVHGIGELLKSGWKPRRTIVFGSWDAEEQGMVGSTEWAEQHEKELANAAAYFNMDVAVSGPNFGASAVPALKQFVRDVTRQVPNPKSGTVYSSWKETQEKEQKSRVSPDLGGSQARPPAAKVENDVQVGDLGSGSDYSAFLQRFGVPATDIGSGGNYGVYHSVFDNFAYFKKFTDPDFKYEQEMARVFGVEMLHMAGADTMPYDYALYGKEIGAYVDAAEKKARERWPDKTPDFAAARQAAARFERAGAAVRSQQNAATGDLRALNAKLRNAEHGLLIPQGLPHRPWFRHAIYAPGEYTGYAAVVIPGVNEAIDAGDAPRTTQQLEQLTAALNRAAAALEAK